MATLTVNSITADAGLNITDNVESAAAGGDVFANDGNTYLYLYNGDASETTLTVTTQATAGRNAVAIADPTIAIAASKAFIVGPFEPGIYNNSSGQVAISYSSETSLDVYVFKASY